MQKGPQSKDFKCNLVLILPNNLSVEPISPPPGTKPLGVSRSPQQHHQLPPSSGTADVESRLDCLPYGSMVGRNRNWRRQPKNGARSPMCCPLARRCNDATAPQLLASQPSKEKAENSRGRKDLFAVDNGLREEHLQLQVLQIQRRQPFSDASRHQKNEPRLILTSNPHPSPCRQLDRACATHVKHQVCAGFMGLFFVDLVG